MTKLLGDTKADETTGINTTIAVPLKYLWEGT